MIPEKNAKKNTMDEWSQLYYTKFLTFSENQSYQCSNITFCFLKTKKTVSPNSRILLNVKTNPKYVLVIFWCLLQTKKKHDIHCIHNFRTNSIRFPRFLQMTEWSNKSIPMESDNEFENSPYCAQYCGCGQKCIPNKHGSP